MILGATPTHKAQVTLVKISHGGNKSDGLAELSSKLDPKQPVVVVCNSAYRSSMATGVLERKGFSKARNLEGGSKAWMKAGLPVFKGEKTAAAGLVPVKATPKGTPSDKAADSSGSTAQPKRTPKPAIPDEGC